MPNTVERVKALKIGDISVLKIDALSSKRLEKVENGLTITRTSLSLSSEYNHLKYHRVF